MIYYADTSWWIAYKQDDEVHHRKATGLFNRDPSAQVLWTQWQRVEVFNAFRQLERLGVLAPKRSGEIIRLLSQEVRLGYWPYADFMLVNAVRVATEVSGTHALRLPVRGMDLFHVAVAMEVGADALLTFDADQAALARAAGLPVYEG